MLKKKNVIGKVHLILYNLKTGYSKILMYSMNLYK